MEFLFNSSFSSRDTNYGIDGFSFQVCQSQHICLIIYLPQGFPPECSSYISNYVFFPKSLEPWKLLVALPS